MNIQVEKKPNCSAELRIEAPAESVAAKRDTILQQYIKQAKIPGFRKGKVPVKVILSRFAKAIEEELRDSLVTDACKKASEQEDLEIMSVDNVGDATFDDSGAFYCLAYITIRPQFDLPDYKNIPVTVPAIEADDSKVNDAIDDIRRQQATFSDVEDRPVAMNDIAVVSYKITIDGTPISDTIPNLPPYLCSTEDYWIKVEEPSLLPGLSKQIEGMKTGESKSDIESTFPDDYHIEELRGKTVLVHVKLEGIKEEILPEADDAFAAKLLGKEATMDQLRERLRENIAAQITEQREQSIEDQIIRHLDQAVNTDLPSHMIHRETQNRVDSMVRRGISQGVSEETITSQQDQIFQAAHAQARVKVKSYFILEHIAKKEQLSVHPDEMLSHIGMMAQETGKPLKSYIKELQKQDALGNIQFNLLLRKALVFLRDNASVSEVEPEETPGKSDNA